MQALMRMLSRLGPAAPLQLPACMVSGGSPQGQPTDAAFTGCVFDGNALVACQGNQHSHDANISSCIASHADTHQRELPACDTMHLHYQPAIVAELILIL